MCSEVNEFYRGRSVFVTGGSGLMGKVLLEKLLYSTDVGRLYVLMRPKRGKTFTQRVQDMWMLPLFHRIRQEKPETKDKIFPIQGDVTMEQLGMSDQSIKTICDEVSVMFHFAATLRLEASLKDCLEMNTAGTKRVLDIAKNVKNLDAFIHLSTAFCYPDYEVLDETVHPASINPHDILHSLHWLDVKQLEQLRPSLLGPHPNAYTYSKRLAEQLVAEAHPQLPVVIVRPSIVTPAFKEPVPGWVDNLNGPIGVMVGAGKGVIRTMLCDGTLTAQVISVDIAINAIITLAQQEAVVKERSKEVPVYNVSSGDVKPTPWGSILEMGKSYARKHPFEWPLWYPNGNITTNVVQHYMCLYLFHLAPAYFIDFLLLIFRQKRFMLHVQGKVSQGLDVLQYFTTRQWNFNTDHFKSIYLQLNDEDKRRFPQDLTIVDQEEYIQTCIEGGRMYCLKESPARIPYSRYYHNFLFVLDLTLKSFFFLWVGWKLMSWVIPGQSV